MTLSEVDWDVTKTVASVVAVDEEGADDTGEGGGMWLWSNWSRCWLFWAKKLLKPAELLAPPLTRLLKLSSHCYLEVGSSCTWGG